MSCGPEILVGKFSSCATELETSIDATSTEALVLEYLFNGVLLKIPVETTEGQKITIPNEFNEIGQVVFILRKVDSSTYPQTYKLIIR